MRTTNFMRCALVCTVLGLTACGGGDGGGVATDAGASPGTPAAASVPDTVPPSAVASIDTFFEYQKTLVASDTIEPSTLQQKLPPIDDKTEPTLIQ